MTRGPDSDPAAEPVLWDSRASQKRPVRTMNPDIRRNRLPSAQKTRPAAECGFTGTDEPADSRLLGTHGSLKVSYPFQNKRPGVWIMNPDPTAVSPALVGKTPTHLG